MMPRCLHLSESASAELMRSFKMRHGPNIERPGGFDSVRNACFAVQGSEPAKGRTDYLRHIGFSVQVTREVWQRMQRLHYLGSGR